MYVKNFCFKSTYILLNKGVFRDPFFRATKPECIFYKLGCDCKFNQSTISCCDYKFNQSLNNLCDYKFMCFFIVKLRNNNVKG